MEQAELAQMCLLRWAQLDLEAATGLEAELAAPGWQVEH